MTNEELELAKRLCAAATPGPWKDNDPPEDIHGPDGSWVAIEAADGKGVVESFWYDGPHMVVAHYDRPFIAASRELVPKLIQEVEHQRTRIFELEKQVEALGRLLDPGNSIKRGVLEEALARGSALVVLDGRRAGVSVPAAHVRPQLSLRLGYNLQPAIPDLKVNDDGFQATLVFGGVPHHCIVPWHAVYAIAVEGQQSAHVWIEDAPPEVLRATPAAEPEPPTPARPNLKLVD